MSRGLLRCLPGLLGLALGCSPLDSGGGCTEVPARSTDAAAQDIGILEHAPPCGYGREGVRGAGGHLVATLLCPGESDAFLVAIKVDGTLRSLKEARGAGLGSNVTVDAGAWEAADSAWHQVELIVDPLNLFKETDETNNRLVARVRTIEPDIALDTVQCRIYDGSFQPVSQVVTGAPLLVTVGAALEGSYRSFELSVRSGGALDVADTLGWQVCSPYVPRPYQYWNWTPTAPGIYVLTFRVTALSGETDHDPTNDALTRTLVVLAPGQRTAARRVR